MLQLKRLPPLPVFCVAALVYTAPGLLPERVPVPLDQLADMGAWKPDPTVRVAVSNRLLSDVVLQFAPWDAEIRRAFGLGRVPWRNAYADGGSPLFANPPAALLSPFTWPRLLWGEAGPSPPFSDFSSVASGPTGWLAKWVRTTALR